MIADYELCRGKRILVVDDDIPVLKLISYNLEKLAFNVVTSTTGDDLLDLIKKNDFHAIILDLVLPKISGLDICKNIRASGINIPIIMLTGKSSHESLIKGFDLGIDDYINKPFLPSELIARLKSVIRRTYDKSNKNIIRVGDITMDITSMRVEVAGSHKRLSAREFKLLRIFMEDTYTVYSREDLLKLAWSGSKDVDIRTIDVHINRLRNALFKGYKDGKGLNQYIRTIRGSGYSLIVENEGGQRQNSNFNKESVSS